MPGWSAQEWRRFGQARAVAHKRFLHIAHSTILGTLLRLSMPNRGVKEWRLRWRFLEKGQRRQNQGPETVRPLLRKFHHRQTPVRIMAGRFRRQGHWVVRSRFE
jgi:hypothetical protein